MVFDKDNTPRKPLLAARAHFHSSPLTPKIASTAGSKAPPSPYHPATIATTPLSRRVAGPSSTVQGYHLPRDDRQHPHHTASSYVNNLSVTPRSGPRLGRVDSGHTTPNGTPLHGDFSHWDNHSGRATPVSPSGIDDRLRHISNGSNGSGSSPLLRQNSNHGGNNNSNNNPDSKFFYASDAKTGASSSSSQLHHQTPPPPALSHRASTFFYANGQSIPGENNGLAPHNNGSHSPALHSPMHSPALPQTGPAAAATSQPEKPDITSKFIYASGAPDRPPVRSPATPTISQSQPPKFASSRTTTPSIAGYTSPRQRPLSPVRAAPPSQFSLQRATTFAGSTRPQPSPSTPSPRVAATHTPPPHTPAAASAPNLMEGVPSSPAVGGLHRKRSSAASSIKSIKSLNNSNSHNNHSRHPSLSMGEPTVSRLMHPPPPSQNNSEASTPASAHFPPPPPSAFAGGSPAPTMPIGIDAILQAAEDLMPSNEEDANSNSNGSAVDKRSNSNSSSVGPLHSPTKQAASNASGGGGGGNASDPLDDLVSNARRERKVQDLEITNASLEAINRQLERQLRKQKAELRNFRRMSRSGRFSLAPPAKNRITSSSTVEGPLQDTDQLLAGLSDNGLDDGEGEDGLGTKHDNDFDEDNLEDDSDDDDFDDDENPSDMETSANEDSDNVSGITSASPPPSSSESSPALTSAQRRRKRDERRMQQDMVRHRQLLVDSQKINQSIKRCLSWTDELIEEGRRALAFQVRVSEIKLAGSGNVLAADEIGRGGRVLAADEVENGIDDADDGIISTLDTVDDATTTDLTSKVEVGDEPVQLPGRDGVSNGARIVRWMDMTEGGVQEAKVEREPAGGDQDGKDQNDQNDKTVLDVPATAPNTDSPAKSTPVAVPHAVPDPGPPTGSRAQSPLAHRRQSSIPLASPKLTATALLRDPAPNSAPTTPATTG